MESMTCVVCGEEKPLTVEFWRRQASTPSGFRRRCKTCLRKQDGGYRERNAEAVDARHRTWRSKPENKAKIKANGERWTSNNPERARERARRWRANNPLDARVVSENYRARRQAVPGEITGFLLHQKFIDQGGCCYYCQKKVGRGRAGCWHVEHIIPISRGGTHDPENIAIACSDCNLRKNNKMPWEFAPDRFSPPV